MRITKMSWMQVQAYLEEDDRVVLPLGSVEQHAWLSLGTDAILAERVALEAAGPLGVPVYPAVPYGLSPYFMAYPGTVTLRSETYEALVTDLLDSLARTGFRRILLVSGHGGNRPAREVAERWAAERDDGVRVRFHEWWKAPRTRGAVDEAGPHGSHANWMESYPWTRIEGVEPPDKPKEPVEIDDELRSDPEAFRELLGDGSFGGPYRIDDEVLMGVWDVAVDETRELLAGDWDQ